MKRMSPWSTQHEWRLRVVSVRSAQCRYMTSLREPAVSGRREWRIASRSNFRAGVQLIIVGTQWFRYRRHEIPAKLKHGQSLRCVGHSVAGILKGKEPSSQPRAQCILAKPHLDKAERCRLLMVGTKTVSQYAPVYLHRVGQMHRRSWKGAPITFEVPKVAGCA